MNLFSWIAQEQSLSNAALTVRAQATSLQDDGVLLHDIFFPRMDVNSTKLADIRNINFRPTADRREWNARGREIPRRTPEVSNLEFIPVESFFTIGEEEIQRLAESVSGNQQIFRDMVRVSVPQRIDNPRDGLAMANLRRLEIDAFQAWALGTITTRNLDSNQANAAPVVNVSYNFDTTRYQLAATAWNDVSLNAYSEFIAWLENGIDRLGGCEGVILRRATYKAIQADAPKGLPNLPLTFNQVQQRVAEDLGLGSFSFYIVENTVEEFTDGGSTTASKNIWPASRIAMIPPGGRVGNMAYAPVARAYEISSATPVAKIDVRGQTAYTEVGGNGRMLTVECQVNAFPMPDESKLWVINTLVT